MAMMTYQKYVETINQNPILNQSDETVQSAIYNWFKYRYIGFDNTDKFTDILQRNVSINYPIYKQKLRIEPGVSQYDWLVSDYRERELKSRGTNNSTVTYNSTTTDTKSGNDTVVKTGSQDTVKSGNDTVVKSGNQDTVKSGNDVLTKTGDQTNTKSGNETTAKSGSQITVRNGSVEAAKSGGHTETNIAGTHTTETSPHVSKVTTHGGHTSSWDGTQQVQAAAPMSKSYSNFTEEAELENGKTPETQEGYFASRAKAGMPTTLDNSAISAQAQSYNNSYNVDKSTITESYEYDKDNTPDKVVTNGDVDNPDIKQFNYNATGEKDTTTYNNLTDTTTYNDPTDTHTYNDVTDTVKYNDIKDTHTYNDLKDTTTYNDVTDTHTYNDVTDKLTYNEVTDTHTYNDLKDESAHTGNDKTEGGDERTDREQMTGRNEDPATLLERATHFIERSSAFAWLKEQIDSCFYPGFYEETNFNGDIEGSCNI